MLRRAASCHPIRSRDRNPVVACSDPCSIAFTGGPCRLEGTAGQPPLTHRGRLAPAAEAYWVKLQIAAPDTKVITPCIWQIATLSQHPRTHLVPEVRPADSHAAQARKNRHELARRMNANMVRPLGAEQAKKVNERCVEPRPKHRSHSAVAQSSKVFGRQLCLEAGHNATDRHACAPALASGVYRSETT
jgi:hypothetical protein